MTDLVVCSCGPVERKPFIWFLRTHVPIPNTPIYYHRFGPQAHELAREMPSCECSGVTHGEAEVAAFLSFLREQRCSWPSVPIVLVASDQNPEHHVSTAQHAQDLYNAKRRVQEWLFSQGADVRVDAYLLVREGDSWRCEHLT